MSTFFLSSHASRRHLRPADEAPEQVTAAINTTPLVDVMLVLLIIFLITVPVAVQSIPLSLPHQRSAPNQPTAGMVTLAVTADGRLFWNDEPLADVAALDARLTTQAAPSADHLQVQIRADRAAAYGAVAPVLALCERLGISPVGFVTDPTDGDF